MRLLRYVAAPFNVFGSYSRATVYAVIIEVYQVFGRSPAGRGAFNFIDCSYVNKSMFMVHQNHLYPFWGACSVSSAARPGYPRSYTATVAGTSGKAAHMKIYVLVYILYICSPASICVRSIKSRAMCVCGCGGGVRTLADGRPHPSRHVGGCLGAGGVHLERDSSMDSPCTLEPAPS